MTATSTIGKAIAQKIEARFGRPIRYSKDCEALSKSIEKNCNERISTTTLKRLFGFAKSIDNPRLFTLDVLATYIGYKDWSSLLADVQKIEKKDSNKSATQFYESEKNNVYNMQQYLVIAATTQNIDIRIVTKLCRQFGLKSEITSFIIDLINIAAKTKNLSFLKKVFMLPKIFDENIHIQEQIYYLGQTVGLVLRANPELAYDLIENYAANEKSQTYLIEWFVDEDYLLGYYGKLIDEYHRHKKTNIQDKVFYYSLKYSQCQQSGDVLQRKEWYSKIKKLSIRKKIHPIPAGRYFGIYLSEESGELFKSNSVINTSIITYLIKDNYENCISFFLYLSRYLFKSYRTDWIVGLTKVFEENAAKRKEKITSHWGVKSENELSIYLAYAYYLMGNRRKARALIKKVDPLLFEVFMYKQIHTDYASIMKTILR